MLQTGALEIEKSFLVMQLVLCGGIKMRFLSFRRVGKQKHGASQWVTKDLRLFSHWRIPLAPQDATKWTKQQSILHMLPYHLTNASGWYSFLFQINSKYIEFQSTEICHLSFLVGFFFFFFVSTSHITL